MKLPGWLADLTDHYGSQRIAGDIARQEAVTALRDEIAEKADRPFLLSLYAEFAGKVLDAWHREHQHSAPATTASHIQAELFPDLKPRLYIRPGVTKPVMSMTAHDWDNAREMVLNRTRHAIEGAETDRENFEKAYGRVRPLLSGDATAADVSRELRGEVPLEGLA